MEEVRWSSFCTYPDGRPKFDADWLLNPANVVTQFASEPAQHCRLCDSYFTDVPAEHVKAHEPSLRDWQKTKTAQGSAGTKRSNFARNHAGRMAKTLRKTSHAMPSTSSLNLTVERRTRPQLRLVAKRRFERRPRRAERRSSN
jgi:hypothetical protein